MGHAFRNEFNPFKPNGIPYCYQLDLSIFVLRVVGWNFSLLLNSLYIFLQANSGDPDIGFHCLSTSHKKDARFT